MTSTSIVRFVFIAGAHSSPLSSNPGFRVWGFEDLLQDSLTASIDPGFGFSTSEINCRIDPICEDYSLLSVSDLQNSAARTMSGVQSPQEKTTSTRSRVGAPAEAPFVPEAASPAERAAGWKNPPSRMQLMMWSGSKRHVFVGLLGVSVLATIPWVLLTSGKKHDSHADYMDRAEGARRSRLSNASAAVAPPTSS